MKRYQMILGAIVAFDLAYVAFACAEDCCSRLHSRWKKKHGVTDEEEPEFFNADDDPDYSPAPPLCVDAIRMVSPFHIRDLVVDRIFPSGNHGGCAGWTGSGRGEAAAGLLYRIPGTESNGRRTEFPPCCWSY